MAGFAVGVLPFGGEPGVLAGFVVGALPFGGEPGGLAGFTASFDFLTVLIARMDYHGSMPLASVIGVLIRPAETSETSETVRGVSGVSTVGCATILRPSVLPRVQKPARVL